MAVNSERNEPHPHWNRFGFSIHCSFPAHPIKSNKRILADGLKSARAAQTCYLPINQCIHMKVQQIETDSNQMREWGTGMNTGLHSSIGFNHFLKVLKERIALSFLPGCQRNTMPRSESSDWGIAPRSNISTFPPLKLKMNQV